ncbi:MAG: hypothetical protein NT007_14420 [Candidatus Kapabacteria bacterium]|nr:hypothetical protein [Candidatus Kapabacteria bacterium]
MNETYILNVLRKIWSSESSIFWSPINPARGQCAVTALVIQDYFGGDILKTLVSNGLWHYYNQIDRVRIDYTAEQFSEEIIYLDIKSNFSEALSETNILQYLYLSIAFDKVMNIDDYMIRKFGVTIPDEIWDNLF